MQTREFLRVVQAGLVQVGFVAPVAGEVAVLVLDSAEWGMHTTAAWALLDVEERQRASRFRFERDHLTYVMAHAIWRVVLAHSLGVAAADVPFASSPLGQPQLPGTGLATSLSHSGRWGAVAVAGAATTGVDIEQSPSRQVLMEMVSTLCTPLEATSILALPSMLRETALLKLWVRKEALLKAFGTGLSGPAPATLEAAEGQFVAAPLATGFPPCCVRNLDLPVGLVGAVAGPHSLDNCRLRILGGCAGLAS